MAGKHLFRFHERFLNSLNALNTGLNLGWSGLPLLKRTKERKRLRPRIIANRIMILVGLAIYGVEGYFGIRLLLAPHDTASVEGVTIVLMFTYGLGIDRHRTARYAALAQFLTKTEAFGTTA